MSLQRALNWSGQGWPVFPVSPENKRPLIEEWQLNATTESSFIRSWWEDHPNAGVGVVPGLVGCFVVDVDAKNGKDGFNTLAELERTHGFETWDSPQQDTPSGGRHLLFRGTAKTSAGVLGPGLDTRGGSEGGGLGYIVAYLETPPCYPAKCPSLPPELVRKLGETKAIAEDRHEAKVELDLPANVTRAKMWLRGVVTPAQGERNASLFKTACTLKDMGLSLLGIFDAIDEFPHVSGDPPLLTENPEEFNTTVRSAWRNGQLAPGIEAVETGGLDAIAKSLGTLPMPAKVGPPKKLLYLWSERRDLPPPPWIVRDLIPQNSLVGLYGPGHSYKSFIALDLAANLATARQDTWAGQDIRVHGPVVYVNGEGSPDSRIRAMEAARKAPLSDDLAIVPGIDLRDPEGREAVYAAIEQTMTNHWGGKTPALIIIDTLNRAAPGVEENSNREMSEIVAELDSLKSRYGCTVMIVHHTPASDDTKWRGATAMRNALDTALLINSRGPRQTTMKVERQKDGATGDEWLIALKEIETGRERDGKPEKSLYVENMTPIDVEKVQKIVDQRNRSREAYDMNRAATVMEILRGMTTQTMHIDTLASQMEASIEGSNAKSHKAWLRAEAKNKTSPFSSLYWNGEFTAPEKENPPT